MILSIGCILILISFILYNVPVESRVFDVSSSLLCTIGGILFAIPVHINLDFPWWGDVLCAVGVIVVTIIGMDREFLKEEEGAKARVENTGFAAVQIFSCMLFISAIL